MEGGKERGGERRGEELMTDFREMGTKAPFTRSASHSLSSAQASLGSGSSSSPSPSSSSSPPLSTTATTGSAVLRPRLDSDDDANSPACVCTEAATRASASHRSISRSTPEISAAWRARSVASRETVFSKFLYRLSSGSTGRIEGECACPWAGDRFSVGRK